MKTKGYKTVLFLSAILVISAITSVQAVGPTIEFIDPTPEDNAEVKEDYVVVNVSITGDTIDSVLLDWNGTNYTMSKTALNVYTYPATNLTNGTYTYKVYAKDTSNNSGVSETRNVTINETTGASFDLELGAGWNLISIPLEIDNTSINAVFPDANDGDELYAYDGSGWQIATYNSEAGWYGDFGTVEQDTGYWYSANTAGTVTIKGTEAGTRTVLIADGWNLIGYTRLTPANLNDLLVKNVTNDDELYAYGGDDWQIATYNFEAQGWYGDMSTMEPGKGYWYNANAPFTWEY
jgi:hypothetical protein